MVHRMMLVPVVVILGTVGTIGLGGNEPPADANTPQTRSEYLRYAALHNAGLKAAFEEWKAALEQIPQAKALPDPRLTYGYLIQEVETRVGPQLQRVSLTQSSRGSARSRPEPMRRRPRRRPPNNDTEAGSCSCFMTSRMP